MKLSKRISPSYGNVFATGCAARDLKMHAQFRAFGAWRGIDPRTLEVVDFEIEPNASIFVVMKNDHSHLVTAILTCPSWTPEY